MSKCCGDKNSPVNPSDPCTPPSVSPCCAGNSSGPAPDTPLGWFSEMIPRCVEYATKQKEAGRPVVGIMCEYTPRELIMAAGGVPVCLCGGAAETIPAAEEHLPANLCPLIKSTFGYHVQGTNPFLEMADLIVAETTCDGKKKMFELMAQKRPMYILELPQKPNDPDAFEHWVKELEKLKAELERRFDTEITNDRLREAIDAMNTERSLRRQLAALMKSAPPPLTGRELLDFKSSISAIPCDFEQYRKALEWLPEREDKPCMKDRVRVMMTGVPLPHGAERVLNIIEDNGGLVVSLEGCTGVKPILDDVDTSRDDLLRAIAAKYMSLPCSVMTTNEARVEMLQRLAEEYRPQCLIDLTWQACLTYDVESSFIRSMAEERLGVPFLHIETDYSPSDSARIAVRVEALFETVRSNSSASVGAVDSGKEGPGLR